MRFKIWLESQEQPKIIDTKDVPEDEERFFLHSAVPIGDGTIKGWHICDDPNRVWNALKDARDIYEIYGAERDEDELGPGLYMSAVPQLWMGRANNKWDFLKRLTKEERMKISQAVKTDEKMDRSKNYGYLSQSEIDRAFRDLDKWVEDPIHDYAVVFLSDQPYNFKIWSPEFLNKLGIKAGTQPQQVEVVARGKFVDLTDQRVSWRIYRDQGLDGAFHRGGFTTTGQLCIWRKKAIVSFNQKSIQ